MVRTAVMDMFRELHNISGGGEAAATFRDVLRAIASDGLCGPDDLHDDSTSLPPKKPFPGVPEHVAAKGLGRAGHISLARSVWRKCVLRNLCAIYHRARRGFAQRQAARSNAGQTPLSHMFAPEADYEVRKRRITDQPRNTDDAKTRRQGLITAGEMAKAMELDDQVDKVISSLKRKWDFKEDEALSSNGAAR